MAFGTEISGLNCRRAKLAAKVADETGFLRDRYVASNYKLAMARGTSKRNVVPFHCKVVDVVEGYSLLKRNFALKESCLMTSASQTAGVVNLRIEGGVIGSVDVADNLNQSFKFCSNVGADTW